MDGLARTAGRLFQTLKVGGVTYTLKAPPIGRLIGDMEAYVISLRKNPFITAFEACSELPSDLPAKDRAAIEERIWKAAEAASVRSGAASAAEMNEFAGSLRGMAYELMTCLEAEHGDTIKTVDDALSLLEKFIEEKGEDGLRELKTKVMSATGEADAKNSSGPNQKLSGKERKRRQKQRLRDGRASINSSRKNSGTRRKK